ncbi:P-type ATPase [Allomyces javanicus]|nr:P-type ATPase [Allomyces javanicus]
MAVGAPLLSPSQEVVSLRAIDGKASIEHLVSIHVQDLFDIVTNPDITAAEVLAGLRYLMVYRIRGGKMPSLDADVMKRLADALLLNMGHRDNDKGLFKRLSVVANEAFCLFVEFLEEVEEFRLAVAAKSAADVRHHLRLDKRVKSNAGKEVQQMAVHAVRLLPTLSPQFADWKDLVVRDGIDDVEKALREFADLAVPTLAPSKERLFPPPDLYFERTIKKVIYMFKTNLDQGLSSDAIPALREHYGKNDLPEPPKPSILKMLFAQLTDFMVIILILAAIVEFIIGEPDPGIVLLVVVVLNVVIGFSQEFQANKALEALASLTVPKARVLRDGKIEEINAVELVPGDVVILEEGDAVPADLRIAESAQLEVIESILTGEPIGILKSPDAIRSSSRRMPLGDCKGNAFMATMVARGRGKGIVVRTGSRTEVGKISSAITATPAVITPIQRKLAKLGKILVVLSFVLCALVVVIGLAWKREVVQMIKVGISLAVSVIPEGLVAVVTVTMALGVRRMAQQAAIVRKLPSVETLGSVTVICSDKTGTLTEGKMGAQELWTVDQHGYAFTESTVLDPNVGQLTDRQGNHVAPEMQSSMVQLAMMVTALCNNAAVVKQDDGSWKAVGDSTEVAMVVATQKAQRSKQHFEAHGWARIGENAFDSDRKVMSVVYTHEGNGFVLAKGAPEAVLQRCVGVVEHYDGATGLRGSGAAIDQGEMMNAISDASAAMASKGLRVLGLAVRACPADVDTATIECEWLFVGLIGLIDPPRKGVRESVEMCKTAGIKVVMITGDHIATATAIATQLAILDPSNPAENRAIRGAELDLLSDEQIASLSPFPNVFARVSPDNKLKIVKALQKMGHSAAMTGDGVNDAPAIKAADVGVAMGIGGTEITKQAADIVLANDNFTTIVVAVEEGRRVFDNIQKFIIYLLSCNSSEIGLMLLTSACNFDLPLTTMVILFANIIADVPPAMAMGVELPEVDIMERPPRDPSAAVLDFNAVISILTQGLSMTLISFTTYILEVGDARAMVDDHGHETSVPEQLTMARTETFLVLTLMQLFQGFISRSTTHSLFKIGLIGNRAMVYAVFISLTCLLIGVYVRPVAQWLELEGPDGFVWLKVLAGLAVHITITECMKMFLRWHNRRELDKHGVGAHLHPHLGASATGMNLLAQDEETAAYRDDAAGTIV